jgi:hypothetical protein
MGLRQAGENGRLRLKPCGVSTETYRPDKPGTDQSERVRPTGRELTGDTDGLGYSSPGRRQALRRPENPRSWPLSAAPLRGRTRHDLRPTSFAFQPETFAVPASSGLPAPARESNVRAPRVERSDTPNVTFAPVRRRTSAARVFNSRGRAQAKTPTLRVGGWCWPIGQLLAPRRGGRRPSTSPCASRARARSWASAGVRLSQASPRPPPSGPTLSVTRPIVAVPPNWIRPTAMRLPHVVVNAAPSGDPAGSTITRTLLLRSPSGHPVQRERGSGYSRRPDGVARPTTRRPPPRTPRPRSTAEHARHDRAHPHQSHVPWSTRR